MFYNFYRTLNSNKVIFFWRKLWLGWIKYMLHVQFLLAFVFALVGIVFFNPILLQIVMAVNAGFIWLLNYLFT